MKRAITNAKAYVARDTFAQAILIEDDKIVLVGSNEEILAAAGDAEVYDAKGRTVVPGFNDSHLHLYSAGVNLREINLLGVTSMKEMIEVARKWIADNNPEPGSLLHGAGWNQDYFTDEKRMPNRYDLDKITTEYPMFLERACGHAITANSKALEMAGIDRNTPQPEGAQIEMDENGEPNGIIHEYAAAMEPLMKEPTMEEMEKVIETAIAYANKVGITSVQTMDIRGDNFEMMFKAYENVTKRDKNMRVYHQCNFQDPEGFQGFVDAGNITGTGDAFNKIGPLKIFVDGSLGARTAYMRKPYADDASTQGIQTLTQEQSDALIQMATDNKMQVAVHAIGDGAITQVLDGYAKVCEGGKNPLRHGIVHCQITDMDMVKRFAENDIYGYIQPIFLHYDQTVVESRVGKELAATSYAFHTMTKLGVNTGLGTDCPVEDLNTMNNLFCAVTRKTLQGDGGPGFHPEENMDIFEAVDGYTIGSAYASFEEDVKGRIAPGYYADLVVLGDDIFTVPADKIKDVEVDATMVGGQFVFEK